MQIELHSYELHSYDKVRLTDTWAITSHYIRNGARSGRGYDGSLVGTPRRSSMITYRL